MPNRTCLVNVDLDGLQVIAQDCSREEFSSQSDYIYLSGLENLLELFDRFRIQSTLFVVGSDLHDRAKLALLRQAKQRGHEFGNHTYSHPRWFKRLSLAQKREEIERCHKGVEDALGAAPRGFRAPGYSISGDVLPLLIELGYLYDSSVLPSAYGSLVSQILYRGRGGNDGLGLVVEPFSFRQLLRKNRPYRPSMADIYRSGSMEIWELPVTCIPVLKFPFHASYVLNSSFWLFRAAELGLKLSSIPVNYLLHLKDASRELDPGDLARFLFNPTSAKPLSGRLLLLERVLERLSHFQVCLTSDYVQRLTEDNEIRK
jgi:hypothetical protein